MAKKRHQRIGIWIIAIVMTIGTIGSFAVMILANDNQQIDQDNYEKQLAEATKQQQQQAEESAASSQPLEGHGAVAFDAASVTELQKEVLVEGDGAEVKTTDTVNVSYFGWIASGKIFDSSRKQGKDTPLDIGLDQVISGWTEGLAGQKVGSTVKLVIPADKAYGAQASGIIPANSPLTFIVKIHSAKASE